MPSAVLHRCPTPTNWLCPCGRVARALRREGYEVSEVREPLRRGRRDELFAATGQEVVPVVVLEGEAPICDSRRIVEHLAWRRTAAAA